MRSLVREVVNRVLAEKNSAATQTAAPNAPAQKIIAIGADHGGFALKQDLVKYLAELGYAAQDCGTFSTDAVDYPDIAYAVAKLVSDGAALRGIIIDGAGIGSAMTANKVPG
ncbi:MAG: RpiB/LacA/LacB family sugar-phosphate isomerase, partial [Chloroflexi bacterium]|nr:RpiB/LacA/LacB family sugar-phosphate isomerase [Chloroflexota bacterium]